MISGSALREAAAARGVQPSYVGHDGRRVRPSSDALRGVLAALGEIEEPRGLEPVVVVAPWARGCSVLRTEPGQDLMDRRLQVDCEDGSFTRVGLDQILERRHARPDWDGSEWSLDLAPLQLPVGYHTLTIDGLPGRSTALLIVPPDPVPPRRTAGFGLFAPLYALRSREDWGIGSFTELAHLTRVVSGLGGELVATLPVYAMFSEPPIDPSPYLPVSRLFWNELYVDPTALPEFARSAAARQVTGSPEFGRTLERLRALDRVDYDAVFAARRRVLAHCAAELFSSSGTRRDEFEVYAETRPALAPYAEFRAAGERDQDPADAVRYHQYSQFVAEQQLAAAAGDGSEEGAGLYLDLPIGVHPAGFDTRWEPSIFAAATVGSPPDAFFADGQSWGFPALHPERIRETGYRYLIETFRTAFRHAKAIRIDHVLGLQRLYWIPTGADAGDGAFVRYRTEEIRAILALEAQRAGALVIGEDLGTVSPQIRRIMDTDGILHSFVYQFNASSQDPFPEPKSRSMATLGSHDLPKFASFWQGRDIDQRHARGEIDDGQARTDLASRSSLREAVLAEDPGAESTGSGVVALRKCLLSLAAGTAEQLVVDIADLELDDVQDNYPGTGLDAGNWRHRHRRSLEEIAADDNHRSLLAEIARRREFVGAES